MQIYKGAAQPTYVAVLTARRLARTSPRSHLKVSVCVLNKQHYATTPILLQSKFYSRRQPGMCVEQHRRKLDSTDRATLRPSASEYLYAISRRNIHLWLLEVTRQAPWSPHANGSKETGRRMPCNVAKGIFGRYG